MKREKKQEVVNELHDRFKQSKIVIVTDFKGLNVLALTNLRRQLKEIGSDYRVVKNTLLFKASEGTDISAIHDHLKGPSAIAIHDSDPVAPAKVLMNFAKENDKLKIKAGVLNGKLLDATAIKKLSDLPSRDVLLSQLLSVMNAVPTSLVRALNDVPRRLLNVLTAIKETKTS